ncbi:MAG: hypothetical protein ACYC4Q_05900 [Victivallaceae bacterium]
MKTINRPVYVGLARCFRQITEDSSAQRVSRISNLKAESENTPAQTDSEISKFEMELMGVIRVMRLMDEKPEMKNGLLNETPKCLSWQSLRKLFQLNGAPESPI